MTFLGIRSFKFYHSCLAKHSRSAFNLSLEYIDPLGNETLHSLVRHTNMPGKDALIRHFAGRREKLDSGCDMELRSLQWKKRANIPIDDARIQISGGPQQSRWYAVAAEAV